MLDLYGRLLSRSTLPLGSEPSKAVAGMIDCMQRIRDSYPKKSLEGIGVSVPGRVDKESQCLVFAPNLKWPKFDIKQAIERRMGLPTEIENAATACLMSELLWFGRNGWRSRRGINHRLGRDRSGHPGKWTSSSPASTEWRASLGTSRSTPPALAALVSNTGVGRFLAPATPPCATTASSEPRAKRLAFHGLPNLAEEGNAHALAALAKQAKYIGRGLRMVIGRPGPAGIVSDRRRYHFSLGPVCTHHSSGVGGVDR